jgi:hypothetical protein
MRNLRGGNRLYAARAVRAPTTTLVPGCCGAGEFFAMQTKTLALIEWVIPFSLVGAIIVGSAWVLAFG